MNSLFKGIQNTYPCGTPFGEVRAWAPYNGGGHEGYDLNAAKGAIIKSELNCVIDGMYVDSSDYGTYIHTKTDLGYIDKSLAGDFLYTIYGHLWKFAPKSITPKTFTKPAIEVPFNVGDFVPAGTTIGYMGNSGHVLTMDNGVWRVLNDDERKDIKCQKGVHLHLSFLTDKQQIITTIKQRVPQAESPWYLSQWNKFWINPITFFKFMDSYK